MTKFGTAQGVGRLEDIRLLTGRGRFVDDIAPAGALFGYFLRAQMAHADIANLDIEAARAAKGVHLVLDAAQLEAMGVILGMGSAQWWQGGCTRAPCAGARRCALCRRGGCSGGRRQP